MRRPFIDLAPAGSARGRVRVPGSKSISNRVLLLAALAEGSTRLSGILRSDDTTVMIDALRVLGVPLRDDGAVLSIDGAPTFPKREADVFVGNSGLSMRTLAAVLAFAQGHYRLSGIARMHERPIGDLVDTLVGIGACIQYESATGYPPLRIAPPAMTQPTLSQDGDGSERVAGSGCDPDAFRKVPRPQYRFVMKRATVVRVGGPRRRGRGGRQPPAARASRSASASRYEGKRWMSLCPAPSTANNSTGARTSAFSRSLSAIGISVSFVPCSSSTGLLTSPMIVSVRNGYLSTHSGTSG